MFSVKNDNTLSESVMITLLFFDKHLNSFKCLLGLE